MSSFSWADCDDEYDDELFKQFEENVKKMKMNTPITESDINERIKEREVEIKPKTEWTKVEKKRKKCYTCFPRNHVKRCILSKSERCIFHFDMCNRPLILVSPKKHCTSLENEKEDFIGEVYQEIFSFCKKHRLTNYTISYSYTKGNHTHLHFKIKADENKINKMKKSHFEK